MRQPKFRRSSRTAPAGAALALILCLVSGVRAQSPSNLGELKQKVTEYKKSGSYDRDVAAVLAKALRFVQQRAPAVRKPAIVLDVDETSLFSWVEILANDYGYIPDGPCDKLPLGPCGAREWELSSRAEVVAPTLALFKAARALGVSVFFITGRPEIERTATEVNLRSAGYDGWTALIMRPPGLTLKSVSEYKAPERGKIAAQGYTILANVGDQPSDLAGGFALRTFLVPNPFYRIP